jgi:hypothetical protein
MFYSGSSLMMGVVGIAALGAEIFGGSSASSTWGWLTSDLFIWLLGFGCCYVSYRFADTSLRAKVVLDEVRISVRYMRPERSADLSEIEGYKISAEVKGPGSWLLKLRNGDIIPVNQWFAVDDSFHAFLARIKKLD